MLIGRHISKRNSLSLLPRVPLVVAPLFSPLIGGVVCVDLVDGFVLEEAGEVVEDREEDNDEDVEVSVQNAPL
jgi:hypothetical protein